MFCFALAALLALVCEASLVCGAEEEDGYSDDDVDSRVARGRRPREYKGPQLLDEITIASATSSTSAASTRYPPPSSGRLLRFLSALIASAASPLSTPRDLFPPLTASAS